MQLTTNIGVLAALEGLIYRAVAAIVDLNAAGGCKFHRTDHAPGERELAGNRAAIGFTII
ncbi:MAG: hypothetical protein HY273_03670 [Gammaproteobacteria bacterium]|nr:hypothetical protein [Gammaproteobacteria bacterium]